MIDKRNWSEEDHLEFYNMERDRKKDEPDCSHCCGMGLEMDDSYGSYPCPFCDGTGKERR